MPHAPVNHNIMNYVVNYIHHNEQHVYKYVASTAQDLGDVATNNVNKAQVLNREERINNQ